MGNHWVSRETQQKREAALTDYNAAVTDARVWLSLRPSLEAVRERLGRARALVGPKPLAWATTLGEALGRMEAAKRKAESLRAQAEQTRAAVAERRLAILRAERHADVLMSAAQDAENAPLYDLRGLPRLHQGLKEAVWRAQEALEAQEAREWESYDANPYEPGEGDQEDPYYDERNAELLAPLET